MLCNSCLRWNINSLRWMQHYNIHLILVDQKNGCKYLTVAFICHSTTCNVTLYPLWGVDNPHSNPPLKQSEASLLNTCKSIKVSYFSVSAFIAVCKTLSPHTDRFVSCLCFLQWEGEMMEYWKYTPSAYILQSVLYSASCEVQQDTEAVA